MKVICQKCGTIYNSSDYWNCPNCGSDFSSSRALTAKAKKENNQMTQECNTDSANGSVTKKCPYCLSDIPVEASFCKFCGQKVGINLEKIEKKTFPIIYLILLIIIAIPAFFLIYVYFCF